LTRDRQGAHGFSSGCKVDEEKKKKKKKKKKTQRPQNTKVDKCNHSSREELSRRFPLHGDRALRQSKTLVVQSGVWLPDNGGRRGWERARVNGRVLAGWGSGTVLEIAWAMMHAILALGDFPRVNTEAQMTLLLAIARLSRSSNWSGSISGVTSQPRGPRTMFKAP